MRTKFIYLFFILLFISYAAPAKALDLDSDMDGLSDETEINIYKTDPRNTDSDNDGYSDKIEVDSSYDPNVPEHTKIDKKIIVNLEKQELSYYLGRYLLDNFKISSGTAKYPTPLGEYPILKKKPLVTYKGFGYFYPNTKWNLMFKKGSWGNFYIHGAYWHNNFGKKVSHGCVNVAYANMENLYNWADENTKISIIPK